MRFCSPVKCFPIDAARINFSLYVDLLLSSPLCLSSKKMRAAIFEWLQFGIPPAENEAIMISPEKYLANIET